MPVPQRALVAGAVVLAAVLGAGGGLLLAGGDDTDEGPRPRPSATASPTPEPAAPPSPSPSPSPTPPPVPPVTASSLRSAAVPSLCDFPAGRLVDGKLPGTTVQLEETAVGDLDGDGSPEGALLLSCSPEGGNLVDLTVHLYAAGTRYLDQVDTSAGLERAVQAQTVRVDGGELEVAGLYAAADDARCCPSGRVIRRFDLRGGTSRLVSPGLDEDARVTGDGWGPIRIGATYDELARATGLPVFLETLEDGPADAATCTYVELAEQDLVALLGGEGRVRSVDIGAPGVLSKSGVGVGSTEQEVLAAYGDRARREPNAYRAVQDVYVAAGPGLVVRFQFTDAEVVDAMHAGEEDYAGLPEGCA